MALTPANTIQIDWPEKLQCLFWPTVNGLAVRYRVLYGGRGGAKSWGIARALLVRAASARQRVLCARELQTSIRDSVHKTLADQIDAMGLGHLFAVERERIFCPSTGSEFFFEGIRNNVTKIKSYEGIDVCWLEEADKVSANSWEVLIPTIRKPGSEIWVSFNPNLASDATYKRFILDPPKNAIVQKISWRDNPFFPEVLYQEMLDLKDRDRDAYLHVWEGECKQTLSGAVYAEELRDAAEDGRICKVPHHRSSTVQLYWDIGHSDHTAIIFEQYVGMQRRVIDFYQNRLKKIPHYVEVLKARKDEYGTPYNYGLCWLPHDAKAQTIGQIKSVQGQLEDAGFDVRIVPRLKLFDGIQAARAIFPTCYFDAKRCEGELLHALRHYHYEEKVELGTLSAEPRHDWSSHAADAFRYMAIASQGSEDARIGRVRSKLQSAAASFGGWADSLGWMR